MDGTSNEYDADGKLISSKHTRCKGEGSPDCQLTIRAVFDRISPTQVVLRFDGSEDLDEFLAAYRPKTTASDPQKTPLRGKDAPRGD